ncbi:type I-C CRISPR-associated protein Cas7/Csd2 [Acidithiobacillus ferrooxidans]|uniref:type I-C CRISPR-associated protein Cas7/Csd2 n=1 Tax=Acidithiobacillus ferrooxidans TaxID=920 RepID=UPI001C07C658|nr:type I-C CRISPR-associated protein Cas7/Csd2 [Acidithiobacillus ferrooxidans]MBU2809510.1 type I-C CRISPR-associated protein Cas7/Csd2 [Acidithiobacillus ferrooxidans F221]MCR2829943.1 type I-C CRISPR-associated protein Cas7/Csd2 [Acidithiobacillus ferrooxidans]
MSLSNRYDFVLLFDVKDGNPNGDPDAGNLPRLDAETGHGLVTDVSLKRKIRNFVTITRDQKTRDPQPGEKRFEIYVREKAILNQQNQRAYSALGLDVEPAESARDEVSEKRATKDKKRKGGGEDVNKARDWMCQNFFDVRAFGAVMSTGVNCGQVRGPVQMTFARSVDPIIAQEHSITRMAVATEAEAEKQSGDNRTMGRKFTVPYGLYMAHGFVSSFLAKQTLFDEDDLELLWQALTQMFEHDRSAAHGEMTTRGLYVFRHDSELGNAPAHTLFERIHVTRTADVPRSFADYEVFGNDAAMPSGVTLLCKT